MADNEECGNNPIINNLDVPPIIEQTRELYQRFLEANPSASIEEVTLPTRSTIAVKNPWGDESVAIVLPPNCPELEEALNNILLPERYTAIWHKDTKDLEIIWTANALPQSWVEVHGRKFIFGWNGHDFQCEFTRASDRLLVIAEHFEGIISSSTAFRNLPSFKSFTVMKKGGKVLPSFEPRSFWIRNIEWDEDKVLEIANNLNFYLLYYDSTSPFIVIHTPKSENKAIAPRTRYIAGSFPSRIDCRPLEDTLLTLWMACHDGDAARKFLYGFRVIEYASYSFLDAGVRKEIKRLLSAPHRLDDINFITESIASALQKSKAEDFQKMETLLLETVSPSLIWREMNRNLSAFTADTVFDGGFKIGKLIAPNSREDDFLPQGILMFHKAIRNIRNALAHGKDQRTAFVITPTTANFERLAPWVSLVLTAASEVVLYKDTV